MTIATGSISVAKGQPLWISENIYFYQIILSFSILPPNLDQFPPFFKDFFYLGGFHLNRDNKQQIGLLQLQFSNFVKTDFPAFQI